MARWPGGALGIIKRRLEIGRRKASANTAASFDGCPTSDFNRDRDGVPRCSLGPHSLDLHILDRGPFESSMALRVRFEAVTQCLQQAVALLPGKVLRFGHLYTPVGR